MRDFTNFDKMITPTIIRIIFWICVTCSVILGLVLMFGGLFGSSGTVLGGLVLIILGPIFSRIQCELLIIIFKINDTLSAINRKLNN